MNIFNRLNEVQKTKSYIQVLASYVDHYVDFLSNDGNKVITRIYCKECKIPKDGIEDKGFCVHLLSENRLVLINRNDFVSASISLNNPHYGIYFSRNEDMITICSNKILF